MESNYCVNDLERQLKIARAKRMLKDSFKKTEDWVKNNIGLIVLLVPPVVGGTATIVKSLSKHHETQVLKDERVYDRSLGHYWELKRKLRNDEWAEIKNRKQEGESLGDILESLKVLK